MTEDTLTNKERIDAAVEIAIVYGGVDEAHHKAWVIDQMLRVLAGGDYASIISELCARSGA